MGLSPESNDIPLFLYIMAVHISIHETLDRLLLSTAIPKKMMHHQEDKMSVIFETINVA